MAGTAPTDAHFTRRHDAVPVNRSGWSSTPAGQPLLQHNRRRRIAAPQHDAIEVFAFKPVLAQGVELAVVDPRTVRPGSDLNAQLLENSPCSRR